MVLKGKQSFAISRQKAVTECQQAWPWSPAAQSRISIWFVTRRLPDRMDRRSRTTSRQKKRESTRRKDSSHAIIREKNSAPSYFARKRPATWNRPRRSCATRLANNDWGETRLVPPCVVIVDRLVQIGWDFEAGIADANELPIPRFSREAMPL